uniref:DUF4347 domain-containing protein n=1 Tax=uncultured Alsobacter sp. TaxID=1748258 RepID=UPI0025E53A8B
MSASRPSDREVRQARAEAVLGLRPSALRNGVVALEPRMIFDGAMAATADAVVKQATDDASHAAAQAEANHAAEANAADSHAADKATTAVPDAAPVAATPPATSAAPASAVEVVFVDSRVSDADAFAKSAGPGRLVVSISADQDGLAAIGDVLDSLDRPVSAIHIVSHGREGSFTLGSQKIDTAAVEADAALLATWRPHLAAGADILLYGCDTGAGVEGAALIAALSRETGADVAASDDATGSRTGADWALEKNTGSIEARMVAPEGWNGSLATQAEAREALGGVDTSKLLVWLDAKTPPTTSNGIQAWANKIDTGTAASFRWSGTGTATVGSDATNGAYVSFAGTGGFDLGSISWPADGLTVFIVMAGNEPTTPSTTATTRTILGLNGNQFLAQKYLADGTADFNDAILGQASDPSGSIVAIDSGSDYFKTQVITAREFGKSGAAQTLDVRSNLSDVKTVGETRNYATGSNVPMFLGASGANGGRAFMTVREVVVFGRSLSAAESRSVEAALAAKWKLNDTTAGGGNNLLFKPADTSYSNGVAVVSRSDQDGMRLARSGGLTIDATNYLSTSISSIGWGYATGTTSSFSAYTAVDSPITKALDRVWAIDVGGSNSGRADFTFDVSAPLTSTEVTQLRVAYRAPGSADWSIVSSAKAVQDGTTIKVTGVLINDPAFASIRDGFITLVLAPDLPAAEVRDSSGTVHPDLRTSGSTQTIVLSGSNLPDGITYSVNGGADLSAVTRISADSLQITLTNVQSGTNTVLFKTPSGKVLPFSFYVDPAAAIAFDVIQPPSTLNTLSPSPPQTVVTTTTATDGSVSYTVLVNEFVANTATRSMLPVAQVSPQDPTRGPYTFSMTGTSLFTIDVVTGWIIVANGMALDYETTQGDIQAQIKVTNGVGAEVTRNVTFRLRDVNDAPALTLVPDTIVTNPGSTTNVYYLDAGASATFSNGTQAQRNVITFSVADADQLSPRVQNALVRLEIDASNSVNLGLLTVAGVVNGRVQVTMRDSAGNVLRDGAGNPVTETVSVLGSGTSVIRLVGKKAAIETLLPSISLRAPSTGTVANAYSMSVKITYNDLGNAAYGGVELEASGSFTVVFRNAPIRFVSNGSPADGLTVTMGQARFDPIGTAGVTGVSIASLFGNVATGGAANILYALQADTNPSASQWGIAITGRDGTNGTWRYSIDAGATWRTLPATMSGTTVLLPSTALLYFEKGADNAMGQLTVRALDLYATSQATTVPADGTVRPITDVAGLLSPETATITVKQNTAPTAPPSFTATQVLFTNATYNTTTGVRLAESIGNPNTATVSGLGLRVSDLLNLQNDIASNKASDADGRPGGIAIVGATSDALASGSGTVGWWYSTDSGVTWTRLTAVSDANALLLANRAATRVFYQAANAADLASAKLTLRVWDPAGAGGTDISFVNGGKNAANINVGFANIASATGAFSNTYQVSLTANTLPTTTATSPSFDETIQATDRDTPLILGAKSGVSIKDIIGGIGYSDVNDNGVRGIMITKASNTSLAYTTDGGLTWNNVLGQTLYLLADGDLTRVSIQAGQPATARSVGATGTFTVRAWDGTGADSGTLIGSGENTKRNFIRDYSGSSRDITVTLKVAAAGANERPVLDTSKQFENKDIALAAFDLDPIIAGTAQGRPNPNSALWTSVSSLTARGVVDLDTPVANIGLAITKLTGGRLYVKSITSTSYSSASNLSDTNALLIGPNDSIAFIPDSYALANGKYVLGPQAVEVQVKAFDSAWSGTVNGVQKSYTAGTLANTNDNDQSPYSAFSTASAKLTLNVLAVNTPPVIKMGANVPANPTYTFTEAEVAATDSVPLYVFSTATVSTASVTAANVTGDDTDQSITRMELTVSNVSDGANEILLIDGLQVKLNVASGSTSTIYGPNATTGSVGVKAEVTMSGTTATIVITQGTGMAVTDATAILRGLAYLNTSDSPSQGTRTIAVTGLTDSGASANVAATSGLPRATVSVIKTNDAPVLNTSVTPVLAAVNEDAGAPSGAVGTLVSTLVSQSNVSDADAGALTGIALTATSTANGTWFYSTNGGANWTAVGTVSDTSALLLAADTNTRLYFRPTADFNGTVSSAITFRAWDRTTGTAGNRVSTTSVGGTTPFSTAAATAAITVNAVNDAPVLNASMTPVLASVNEDAGAPAGAVGTLVSALVSQSGAGANVTDADAGASTGLALTGTAATSGTWWYSTNGGSSWTAVGAVSDTSALLLAADGNTRLYFQPSPNFNGSVANAITFRAWDQTSGTAGSKVDTTTNGGTTAFSTATDTADISVNAVNDAPVLDASKTPLLASVNKGAGVPAGPVGTLVSALVSQSGAGANVTDPDSGALTGLALTATATANGTWWYSTNGGSSWAAVGAVSDGSALLLAADANTRLYFQPSANFSGPVANAITFRAWDQTLGTAGSKVDTTTNGGTTAFSTATDTADITVNAVNAAPVLDASKTPLLSSVNKGASAPAGAVGTLVTALVSQSGAGANVTDADTGASTGLALTATATTNGTWWYSTDGGTSWAAVGAVSDGSALLLAADANTRLYFQPSANFSGLVANAITFRAWDQTSGTAGSKVDTTTNGGTTAFSTATDTADITVNAVNNIPVLAAVTQPGVVDEAANASSQQVVTSGTLSVTDLDVGNTLTASADAPLIQLNGATPPAGAIPSAVLTALQNAALTLGAPATSDGGTKTISWGFDNTLALDWLKEGDVLTLTYFVKVSDGTADSSTQYITITIRGANDAPTITVTDPAAVTE